MKQRKGTKVYDGGEKFFDRYTIIFPGFEMALGLSGNPNSPQGFSQWGQFKREEMGRRSGGKICRGKFEITHYEGTKGVRKNEADDEGVRGPLQEDWEPGSSG